MAREIFFAYHNYLEAIEPLDDAERGRLFTACLNYSMTGEAQVLSGNERFVFPAIRSQIDRDREKYEKLCEKNAETAKVREKAKKEKQACERACTGVQAPAQTYTNKKKKEKEKEKNRDNENNANLPLTPSGGQMAFAQEQKKLDDLAEPLRSAMLSFAEMRQKMKAPLTCKAVDLTLTELERLAPQATDKQAHIVQQSVQRGWRGVFPLPEDCGEGKDGKKPLSMEYAQRKYSEKDLAHLYVDLG